MATREARRLASRRSRQGVLEPSTVVAEVLDEATGPIGDPLPAHAAAGVVTADVERSADLGSGDVNRHIASRGLIFFIVSMALFMASIDATIVATALPKIERGLNSRLNWTAWSITIYQLGQIIAAPLAGRISDQYGRKKVFVLCAILFTVTSLFCGLATSIYMLIPLRFIQALGGGAFLPSATGIVSDTYGKDRDRAIGMFTSIFPIGGIAGPVFGGVIAQYWSWRGIFFINIPIGIVLILLAIRFIPRTHSITTERLDYKGVALMASLIVSGMFGITSLGEKGVGIADPRVFISFIVAIVLTYLFFRHTKRTEAPFIPMRLLTGKGFLTMNVLNVLYGSAALGFGALVPLYAENRYHIEIANAGLLLSARAVGMISIAAVSALMLRRTGYRLPMTIGFSTIAVGLVLLSIGARGVGPYWWLAIFSLVTGLGMGTAAPATNNATLQLAPDHVAVITGLRGMFRQSGGILYVSVATALLSRSQHPGLEQAHVFLFQAVILLVMISLVYLVPDHRGRW